MAELLAILLFLVMIIFFLLLTAIPIALFIFWIVQLVDCVKREKFKHGSKLIWVLIIIFLSWLGAFIYYFVEKKK